MVVALCRKTTRFVYLIFCESETTYEPDLNVRLIGTIYNLCKQQYRF